MAVDLVARELAWRRGVWQELLERGGPADVERLLIREVGMYGGAQGVWVDATRTRRVTGDGTGIAVGLLHTGRHYADDLSETGILYHYPRTGWPPGRDAAEVAATKRAGELGLPVFVITPSQRNANRRDVHLGWFVDWDDDDELFLVTFTDEAVTDTAPAVDDFRLFADDVEMRRVEAIRDRISNGSSSTSSPATRGVRGLRHRRARSPRRGPHRGEVLQGLRSSR